MKKRILLPIVASLLSLGLLAGCGGAQKTTETAADKPADGPKTVTLKVGAVPVPHAEILKFIQPAAEKEGIKVQIVEFTDYIKPNTALAEKELDANYFQHQPYLTQFNADHKYDLVSVGAIHLEPMGLYSLKVADIKEIKRGATIAIPDDPTNAGRALNLLAQNGLITLKNGAGVKATAKDIDQNPKNLKIQLLTAEVLPRTLQDVDATVINTNYYLEAQKNLKLDAKILARESAVNNPYANLLVVRTGDENRPEIQKLIKLLQSPDVKKFIEDKYNGAIVPAF